MARQLSVKTGVKVDSVSNITQQIQSQLDSVSKRLKINVGEVSFGNMDAVINDLKSKLSEIGKLDILSPTQNQSTQLKSMKGDYEDILSNMTSLKTEIMLANGELAKMKVVTDSKSNVKSGTLSYQYDEARKAIEQYGWVVKNVEGENVKVFELVSRTFEDNVEKQAKIREQQSLEMEKALKKTIADRNKYENELNKKQNSQIDKVKSQDYLNSQNEAYSKIISLQNEEFKIKTQLISAEGEYKKELTNTLEVVEKLKEQSISDIGKNNLTNSTLENKLLKEREVLTRNLNLEQAKFNTKTDNKFTKELETQNRYLDQQISKLKMYKQSVESRGGGKPETQSNLIKDLDNQINKINELKKANNILGQAEKTRIQESTNALKVQTNELVKYQSSFSNIFKKMTNYALGGSIIYGGIAQVKQGINDIISLDTAMRDLGKVAKATTDQLKEFPQVANDIAISIGTSTEAVIDATTYYSRLGYAIEEATTRAKNATVFANVADMGIDDATKALITIQKGFDLNKLEDMTRIMDSVNEVGNNFSSSASDIAEGMRQMGNAMNEAGNSMEQSIGIFIAGNASVQDASKTGNAIKTIGMRLRGMKTEIDETSIPVSKLREEIKQLTGSAGQMVDIMLDDNTFKSTYQQMTELAEVYPKLTDGQRAYLQYVISGQRQGNIFSGIMNNMKEGVNAYETALNSSGSAMKEQERYMNSIQGKMNEFTETLKKVWVDAINTDSVKSIVDIGTGLLNVLDGLINTFGVVPTVVGGATLALGLFNKELYNSMMQSIPVVGFLNNKINGLANTVGSAIGDKIINSFVSFSTAMKTAKGQSIMLATGNMVLTASLKAVEIGAMLAGVALTMGLSLVITALVSGITKLADKLIVTKKEMLEFNKQSTETAETLSNTVSSATKLQGEIDKINEKLATTTDISERNKLTDDLVKAQTELSKVLPESATGINEQGVAISNNNSVIEEQLRLKKEEQRLNAIEFANSNKDIQRLEKYKNARKEYNDMLLAYTNQKGYDKEYTQNYNGMAQVKQSIKIDVDKGDLEDSKKKLEEINTYYSQLAKQVNSLKRSGFTSAEIEEILPNSTQELLEYNRALAETQNKSDGAKNGSDNLKDGLKDVAMSAEEAKNAMKDLGEAFGGYSDKLEFLNKIQKEFAEYGGLTDNSITTLISKYGDLAYLLTDQANFQKNLQTEIGKTTDSYNKSYNEIINTARIANGQVKQEHADKINSILNNEAEFANYLGGIYDQDLKNYISALRAKLATYQEYIEKKSNLAVADPEYQDDHKLQQSIKFYDKYMSELERLVGASANINYVKPNGVRPVGTPSSSSSSSGNKSEVADLELKLDRYRELEIALKNVNNAIEYNEVLMKNASDKEKVELLKEQAFLYERQREALVALKNEQLKEQNEVKNKLASNGFSFNGDTLTGANNRLKALQSWANSASGDEKKKRQEQVKELEDLVKLYEDLIGDKIPNSNKQITDVNNSIIESQKQIADILKKQKDEFIKAEEEKTKKVKDELQKRKDLMNQEWKQEDYEDKLKSEQDKLNELESALQVALRTGNTALVESLKRQIAEQQKVLSDTIRDNERENANNKIDKEMEDLDKNLQDKIDNINNKLTDEELLKMVQQGVTDLSGILDNIGNSTKSVNNAFAGISTIIQDEWIGSLDLFEEKLKGLQAITFNSNDLGINVKQSPSQQSSIRDINITMPFTVNGDVNKDTMEDITEAMEDMKEEIIREIDKTLKR